MSFLIDIWYLYGDMALVFVMLIAFIFAIYFAIVPHEVAHGLVAKWNGDLTAQVNGRLTMNPMSHFDLVGFAMLVTMGFGYAKPVPVNPYNFKVPRRGLFTVAIAGVTYNLIAAVVSSFFIALMTKFMPTDLNIYALVGTDYLFVLFYYFFRLSLSVNIMLFLFNILPLGPLDGFKIIEAYASRDNKFVEFLRRYGTYILIALFVLRFVAYFLERNTPFAWVSYVDVLGLYLGFFSHWVGGGILSLFTMMFGLGPIGFAYM